ncbi:hypothetical protein B0H19DRAFT_1271193 [Mycena capillaripes]|nr:hypothetical protein B0H19DRAFT_1271193 [Mycena capillaripes]
MIEMHGEVVDPWWLGPFVAMRAAMGAPISDLTLPKWNGVSIALAEAERAPTIHSQRTGPSHALMDGVQGPDFYLDKFDMRRADFAYVNFPGVRLSCACCEFDWDQWVLEENLELLEEDIARDFKIEGDLLR